MIDFINEYFYLVGVILFIPLWVAAYIKCKDVREEMIICGIIFRSSCIYDRILCIS